MKKLKIAKEDVQVMNRTNFLKEAKLQEFKVIYNKSFKINVGINIFLACSNKAKGTRAVLAFQFQTKRNNVNC